MAIRDDLLADCIALYTGEDASPTVLTDYSGLSHDGVINPAVASWSTDSYLNRPALTGNASADQAAIVANAAWLIAWQNGTSAFSLWFKPGTLSDRRIIGLLNSLPTNGNTGFYYQLQTSGYNAFAPFVYWRGASGSPMTTAIRHAGHTQWRHMGMQRSVGNVVTVWIDGSLVYTSGAVANNATNGDLKILGPEPNSDGSISEIALFDRVLTASEWAWLADKSNTLSSLQIGGTAGFTGIRGLRRRLGT